MAAATAIQPQKIKEVQAIQHDRQLVCCRLSQDRRFLFAAGFDGKLHRWDLEDEQHKHESFPGHSGWVESMLLHPGKNELFTADSRGTLHCWPLGPGALKPRWTTRDAHSTWLRKVAISPDGKILATCGNDKMVRVFSAADGKRLGEFKGHASHVQSVAFHNDGKSLASGDLHGVIKHWNLEDGKCLRDLDASKLYKKIREYDQGGVRSMTFDSQGKTLFCGGFAGSNPNQGHGTPTVVAIDWTSGKQSYTMTPKADFKGPVLDLAYHPAGFLLGIGSSEAGGALWFWKPGETKEVHLLKNKTSFRGLGLHADGLHLAAAAFGDRGGQRGGNGRRLNAKGEYLGFAGNIVLYELG